MKNILQDVPDETLSSEQEAALAAQKTEDSLNTLALHNLRQAFFYGRRCYPGVADDELLSVCYQALLAAAKNFKLGQIRFFGFAKPSIRHALGKYARTKDVVRRGPRETEVLSNPEEEAEDDDTSTAKRKSQEPDATMPALEEIHIKELWLEVAPLLQKVLTPEERCVLELNFCGSLNLRECGELLNRSRASMSLIKIRALKKLQRALVKIGRITPSDL